MVQRVKPSGQNVARPNLSTSRCTFAMWRRASALRKRTRATDESGASLSARYSGCASMAASRLGLRSTIWANLGSDARTRAAVHCTWSETKRCPSKY